LVVNVIWGGMGEEGLAENFRIPSYRERGGLKLLKKPLYDI